MITTCDSFLCVQWHSKPFSLVISSAHLSVHVMCKLFFLISELNVGTGIISTVGLQYVYNKSSAIAEMGDRGHNRHRPKRGGAVPVAERWEPV